MPETQRDLTYDDEMDQLLWMSSEWLADVLELECKFAVDSESAKLSCRNTPEFVSASTPTHNTR
ncbi:hypothetical protein GQ600_11590 [Phytophthora cactorum]|nr:hypothetical protein GQ600_11590 [Phytophthora cactorum]